MSATKIEWCDFTINPVVGCSKCSRGCEHCYAERFAARLAKNPSTRLTYKNVVDAHGHWTGKISCVESEPKAFDDWWNSRLRRMKMGSRVFVGSMTDLFHEDGLGFEGLLHLWETMDGWPDHTFCILTKRPERMREFALLKDHSTVDYPLLNVWLGVTVCEPGELWKIDELKKIPAARRFVCFEPLLADMGNILPYIGHWTRSDGTGSWFSPVPGKEYRKQIDWVIAGPETGPSARPAKEEWFRSLLDQCYTPYRYSQIPFFLKKNADGSRLLDGREWNEVPV
jgi:protein gp37